MAAFLVSRSCGATETTVSKDEAIAIAKRQIDYTPDRVQIRLLKRGLQQSEFWAVSLATVNPDKSLGRVTVVVLSARTGEVNEIRANSG